MAALKICALVFGIFALAALCSVVVWFVFSPEQKLFRALGRVIIPRLTIEDGNLSQVAVFLKNEFAAQGLHCEVVIDHAIADKTVPRFFVGQGNAELWTYAVGQQFDCERTLVGKDTILFRQKRAHAWRHRQNEAG